MQSHQPSHNVADGTTHALSSDVNSESWRHARDAREPYSVHTASFRNRNDNYLPGNSGGLAGNPQNYSSYPKAPIYDHSRSQHKDELGLPQKNSIPRKQLNEFPKGQFSGVQPSLPRGHAPSANVAYPLQSDPANYYDDPQLEETKNTSAVGVLDRSRPISKGPEAAYTAERVVDRAKNNTINTEVIETFAPGKPTLKIVVA